MNSEMRSVVGRWVVGLLLLAAEVALGQTLSLRPKGERDFVVEADVPLEASYALQGSANLHLWIDLCDAVQGSSSFTWTGTAGPRCFFRLTPRTQPLPPVRIMLIGDSTASDCCGWGQGLYPYFKPNAQVVNYAYAWHSTKIFLTSAEFDKLLIVKPDIVFAQFGYMDTASLESGRGTTIEEFSRNLRTIVRSILGFNGVPILITPSASMTWNARKEVVQAWPDRCAVVREVAAEFQLYLVDLNRLTMDLYNEQGESGTKYMEYMPGDRVHLSPQGAQVVARIFVNALPDSLGPYLVGSLGQLTAPAGLGAGVE